MMSSATSPSDRSDSMRVLAAIADGGWAGAGLIAARAGFRSGHAIHRLLGRMCERGELTYKVVTGGLVYRVASPSATDSTGGSDV